MTPFLIRWLTTAVAVFVAVQLTGIRYETVYSLGAASLLLGIVNAFVRPVLLILSVPFILVTMGGFILVINALLLWLVGGVVPGFFVPGFWNAFFGAIIVSLVSWGLSSIFRGSDGRVHVITHHSQMKSAQARTLE